MHLIDLTKKTPQLLGSIETGGQQPSGMAVSQDGRWVAVANRAANALGANAARIPARQQVHLDGLACRADAATPLARGGRYLTTTQSRLLAMALQHC